MACAVLETNIAHAATVAYANKTLLRISILRAVFPTNSSLALYGRGATPLLQRRYFPHISVCYNLFFSPITAPRFIVATNPHFFSASGTIFCSALFRYRSIRARGATAMCSGVPPLRAYACAAVLCARCAVRIRTAFSSKTSHARMHNRLSHNNHRPSDGALSRHLDARRRHSTVAYSRG